MSVIQQFLAGLDNVIPAPPPRPVAGRRRALAATAPPPLLPGQMVIPATAWSWPDPVIGTTGSAQFHFADAVPQSTVDGALYQPSSRSFSQSYMTFLRVLASSRFPYPDLLQTALQQIAPPTGDPATAPTPPGWTKVTEAGYAQWRPIWTLQPPSASAWMAAVEAGTLHNPNSLRLALNEVPGGGVQSPAPLRALGADGSDLPLPAATLDTVTITAACWDQVFVYPGSWYDASMLALGRSLLPDPSAFFGPNGLMAGRVAAFYVALSPSFDFTAAAPIPGALRQTLDQASTVLAMGVPVRRSPTDGTQGQALLLESAWTAPAIVGVRIEMPP